MSGLQTRLHEERKARLLRFKYAAARVRPKQEYLTDPADVDPPAKRIIVGSMESYYPNMWFWDLVSPETWHKKQRTVKEVQLAVCKSFGFSLIELKSHRRPADLVRARQAAMYLAKKLTLRSLPAIGREFGDRDHTTVLHAIRKIERLLQIDEILAGSVNVIMGQFT